MVTRCERWPGRPRLAGRAVRSARVAAALTPAGSTSSGLAARWRSSECESRECIRDGVRSARGILCGGSCRTPWISNRRCARRPSPCRGRPCCVSEGSMRHLDRGVDMRTKQRRSETCDTQTHRPLLHDGSVGHPGVEAQSAGGRACGGPGPPVVGAGLGSAADHCVEMWILELASNVALPVAWGREVPGQVLLACWGSRFLRERCRPSAAISHVRSGDGQVGLVACEQGGVLHGW